MDEKLTCRESQYFSAWPLLIDSPVCERWLSRESSFERGRSRAALMKAATTVLFVKVVKESKQQKITKYTTVGARGQDSVSASPSENMQGAD